MFVANLQQIHSRLASHSARREIRPTGPHLLAAVALAIHAPANGSPEILLIERATHESDPWSGQMSFPGGHYKTEDENLERTAIRETQEETGLVLEHPLGPLDEVRGLKHPKVQPMIVAPFAFEVPERPRLRPNREVESTVWVPVSAILDPGTQTTYHFERAGFSGDFPALRHEGYTIWGITYKILTQFAGLLGVELPTLNVTYEKDLQRLREEKPKI